MSLQPDKTADSFYKYLKPSTRSRSIKNFTAECRPSDARYLVYDKLKNSSLPDCSSETVNDYSVPKAEKSISLSRVYIHDDSTSCKDDVMHDKSDKLIMLYKESFPKGIQTNEYCTNLEKSKVENLSKPCFIVGGAITSPRNATNQSSLTELPACLTESHKPSKVDDLRLLSNPQERRVQEDSLTSAMSLESTQPHESSECFTPVSVVSMSSFASSKKLEWDSGADLGYVKKSQNQDTDANSASFNTLERIAIENASILQADSQDQNPLNPKKEISS